jgi:protease-4
MAAPKGWIVALIVVFGVFGLGLVGLGVFLSQKKVEVKPATTLVLDFKDEVLEDTPSTGRSRFFYRDTPTLWDYLRALDHASHDRNIEAVLLKIDGVDMGWAKSEELRVKLEELEERGKKVIAYVEGGEDQDYLLASAADVIYMAPSTSLGLDGVASSSMYFKGTMDKIGIKADIEHIGEYKDAAEPFTRTEASDAAREAENSLLDESWNTLVHGVMESRGLDSTTVVGLLNKGPFTSQQAMDAGLVDSLVYDDELESLLPGGEGGERLDLEDYLATLPSVEGPAGAPKIAIINAAGTIVSGKSGIDPVWGRTVGSDTFLDAIDDAKAESNLKAIVVRVDSPGGEVFASHKMWRALKRAATEVPIVASFSDLAASGGYYMAMGADTILSDEATLTGSIGVVGGKFNLRGVLDKVGVNVEENARGDNAQWMSSLRDFTPAERERFVSEMFDEYKTFVGIVAENRGSTAEDIDPIARGRVWTGGQAYENGLVDELGGLEEAIATAKVMAGLPKDAEVRVEVFPRVKHTLLQEVVSKAVSDDDAEELSRMGGSPVSWAAGGAGLGLVGGSGLELWLRHPAELLHALARIGGTHTFAILPFRIRVH